ncbi:MAG: GAF domain-containing protein [Candidatus Margulisiibacteriota bacterium]
MGGTCALYNRLNKDLLVSEGKWQTPPDYQDKDKPEGHICYDVIKNTEEPLVVRDLPSSKYAESDPYVKKYDLKTYIGHAVKLKGKPVGSLCVVYQQDKDFNDAEKRLLSVLAKSLAVEEERKTVADDLHSKMSDLEIMNRAAVGRELKMIELEEEIKKLRGGK